MITDDILLENGYRKFNDNLYNAQALFQKKIKHQLTNNEYKDTLKEIQEYIDILSDEDSDIYNEYFEDKKK